MSLGAWMRGLTIRVALVILTIAWGASVSGMAHAADVAVEINGQAIAVEDIEQRIRDIHRSMPRTGSSGSGNALDVRELVDSLVDERLMIEEAAAMGLADEAEFRRRMWAYVRDQSILRLYAQEVVERVQVDEAAIGERYAALNDGAGVSGEDIPEQMRERIVKALRQEREKVLAAEFVDRLRAGSEVVVHRERLLAVTLPLSRVAEQGAVAEINGHPVSMADFMADLGREYGKAERMLQRLEDDGAREAWLTEAKERVLEGLIVNALVGSEALKRDYSVQPDFVQAVDLRRSAMLLGAFRVQVLLPLADIGEKELRDFYQGHAELYTRGCQVRLGELRYKDQDEALAAQDELRRGAVFGFLARRLGGSSTLGDGWVSEQALPPEFRGALELLPEGGVSDVLILGRDFVVLKLRGRRGCEVMPFDEALPDLRRRVGKIKYAEVREQYAQALRSRANIVVHDEVLDRLEELFWQSPPETAVQPERGNQ